MRFPHNAWPSIDETPLSVFPLIDFQPLAARYAGFCLPRTLHASSKKKKSGKKKVRGLKEEKSLRHTRFMTSRPEEMVVLQVDEILCLLEKITMATR